MSTNQFRSTLMQQFASAARNQSRPPLALVGWLSEEDNSTSRRSSSYSSSGQISEIHSSSAFSRQPSLASIQRTSQSLRPPALLSSPPRLLSSLHNGPSASADPDSEELQKLIRTRRTNSYFLTNDTTLYDKRYWQDVLTRAAECGYTAPNHKRSEPFTFKSIVAPSPKIDELASIAYHVSLRRQHDPESDIAINKAEKKRAKWQSIPAYLVALVGTEKSQVPDDDEVCLSEYDEIPFVAPSSERELEDYAAACAAVQNVLLSLHAEDVGSKWATGPVVKTKAFRHLVEARDNERVVGLVMVGKVDDSKKIRPRRHRRELEGDVLVQLSHSCSEPL